MFYNNGVIVQNIAEQLSSNTNYMGLSRFQSWPLEKCLEGEAKKISEKLCDQWLRYYNYRGRQIYSLNSITSYQLFQSYVKLCEKNSLRIIGIETEYDFYERMSFDFDKDFLGYDFIYPTSDYYSALGDEYDIVDELGFTGELNSNGLFDDVEALKHFIEVRNNKQKLLNIEPNDEFAIVRVSRVLKF